MVKIGIRNEFVRSDRIRKKFDYVSFLSEAKTTDQLKERYEQIKTDYEKGIINEIEKDELRKMANILWFKIGDSNKKK